MYETILPSSLLQYADNDYYSSFANSMNNTSLKVGIVKTVIYPNDSNNQEKKAPEYDVMVFQQDKDKGVIPITYRNCVTMDMFGGISDFFEFVKGEPTNKTSMDLGLDDGSYVLLLCIDGTATRGVIIGALPHHNRKSTLPQQKAKQLTGEYNGLRISINDNGELTMTFKGKTDSKGIPTTKVGGSQIKIEKDGSVEINDRDLDGALKDNSKDNKDTSVAGSNYEKIRIDKTNKAIIINSRGDFNHTIGGNTSQKTNGNHTQTMADFVCKASGSASITSGGAFDVKATGAFGLKAASGKFELDSSLEVKASTIKISGQTINVGEGGSPAVVMSSMILTIGNLGIPAVGQIIGPFSSSVMIAS
jgi:hypothetical protein